MPAANAKSEPFSNECRSVMPIAINTSRKSCCSSFYAARIITVFVTCIVIRAAHLQGRTRVLKYSDSHSVLQAALVSSMNEGNKKQGGKKGRRQSGR